MKLMSNARPELVPSDIAVLTLGSGLISTVMFRVSGLQCPLRAIGLACPGCGCGRAVVEVRLQVIVNRSYGNVAALVGVSIVLDDESTAGAARLSVAAVVGR